QKLCIGCAADCDIPFDKDDGVAEHHCWLEYKQSRWFIIPEAGEPVWLDDQQITAKTAIDLPAVVFLGYPLGPAIRIASPNDTSAHPALLSVVLKTFRTAHSKRLAEAASAAAEKPYQRRVIRRAFGRMKTRYKKHLRHLLFASASILLAGTSIIYWQQTKLDRLRTLAEDLFYRMKTIELQIARTEDLIEATGDSSVSGQNAKLWSQFRQLEKQYDSYLRELGFGASKMPEDERIILRMARVFGECELNAPEGFVQQVRTYINKWRTTPRYREAITRALKSGYVKYISETMIKYHLPPHFMYLAMQESDFDPFRCGPRTRYGIAKGMWQFIPTTAVYFGLKIGPLVGVRRPDPQDERHNVYKSTVAAAKYIKFLYTTEAQASGLLVMACYNWGESKVRRLVNRLPENPRQRNFWNLMKQYKLPRETRDYVFYIFSAAVIGENPKLFGFDLDSPIAAVLNSAHGGA
ncbi:MAG: hypothetical protein D6814_06240, partial [Calditrichaeota bacterium]